VPVKSDVEKQLAAARARADDLAAAAAAAKEQARAAAAEAEALQTAVDREAWIEAQLELGHSRDDIDAERGIVTSLPTGPVYG
jgi:hypothetical protein